MELAKLSIEQLAELRDNVTTTLQNRIEARRNELKAENDRLVALNGPISPVTFPKYVHPDDSKIVVGPKRAWSGRGSKPKWVEDWLEKGGTLEQLLCK